MPAGPQRRDEPGPVKGTGQAVPVGAVSKGVERSYANAQP